MPIVRVVCKLSGAGAPGASLRVAVDVNRDGQMQASEEVDMTRSPVAAEWTGQIQVPGHTINMLILVAYDMWLGTKLEAEAVDAASAQVKWKRDVTAITSKTGWILGYLG